MSAQKILVASLVLFGLYGCGEVKSPTFKPQLIGFEICEQTAGACPTDGALCRVSSNVSNPSLVALNRKVQYCALARFDALQGSGDSVTLNTNTPWKNVTKQVAWTSADSAIASIDKAGLATGNAEGGPVEITAKLGDRTLNTFLEVTAPALQDIAIFPNGNLETLVGAQIQFQCRGSFTGPCATSGATICDITDSADFSSNDSGRFTVSSGGNGGLGEAIAATASGQRVNVVCSDQDVTKQPPVTLTSNPPASISVCDSTAITSLEIVPNALRLPVGQSQQLALIANYTSCTTGQPAQADVTLGATWSSTDVAAATVDTAGVVSGVAEGQSEITGTFGGLVSPPLLVVVSDTVVQSIRVDGPAFVFAVPGQSAVLDYTAYAVLADINTGVPIGEQELLDAPAQPFASWASDAPAISFADVNVSSADLDGSAVAQMVEISATYAGLTGTLQTEIFDLSSVKGLEITPSVACVADELELGLLGDPIVQLTAHATVQPAGAAECSLPVTNFVNWDVGPDDLTTGLLSNINIPGLGPVLAEIVTTILGNCEETLPVTVGEGSPVVVSDSVPKGQVSGNGSTLNLAGGACVRAYIGPQEDAVLEAFSSVLVATELQPVCGPLLAIEDPTVAVCP